MREAASMNRSRNRSPAPGVVVHRVPPNIGQAMSSAVGRSNLWPCRLRQVRDPEHRRKNPRKSQTEVFHSSLYQSQDAKKETGENRLEANRQADGSGGYQSQCPNRV